MSRYIRKSFGSKPQWRGSKEENNLDLQVFRKYKSNLNQKLLKSKFLLCKRSYKGKI